MTIIFAPRLSIPEVEEGHALAPRFSEGGLMPCVTTDAADGTVLMLGWMNPQALRLTIETGRGALFQSHAGGGLAQGRDFRADAGRGSDANR